MSRHIINGYSGYRKLLLSSDQKLGLLPNILQGKDQPPVVINYPVHD